MTRLLALAIAFALMAWYLRRPRYTAWYEPGGGWER